MSLSPKSIGDGLRSLGAIDAALIGDECKLRLGTICGCTGCL